VERWGADLHGDPCRECGFGWELSPAYVSQVTGNLRTWAERLAGGYLAGDLEVPGYDPDLLARARHYNEVSLAGAL